MKQGWRVFGASVVGKSHLDKGLPCQDAHAQAVDGSNLVAVVCDGAGSARHSDEGAQFVADQLVLALAARLHGGAAIEELHNGALEAVLAQIRAALEEKAAAASTTIDDYATTVVGVVMGPDVGLFFHLGDGLAVAQMADGAQRISLPANGEYANETYFLSSVRWRDHLRLLPLSAGVESVVLMSDGCMPFAMARQNASLYAPYMGAVEGYLRGVDSVEAGNMALAATLADPRTHQITGDDKTLLLAWRA